ncbi:C2 domain-containing protein 3-like [Mytilus trossulus]|uniref:C2 domain-containing protein 3-like n=1 Tax=Mytilus trossulus TaxID=6551 RepID=UPI0030057AA1
MVKKKQKGTKSTKKQGEQWQKEDVQVHTGLPPQVEGQLRCFLRVSIPEIVWVSPSPPVVTHVRVKWWGEDGDGALFRPLDVKQNDKASSKTIARYPIRSGPKQFASYLGDMGSIILEILSGPLLLSVGYAEVTQIGQLSPNRPVKGFYPVFTEEEQKIAEIQVSLVLESLMASYDSNGSVPTTDISFETQATQESMYPQRNHPVPHSQAPRKPVDDPFISPASHQNVDGATQNGFADYASDLRQQLNYSMNDMPSNHIAPVRSGSTVNITTNGDVVTTDLSFYDQNPKPKKSNGRPSPSKTESDRNLLSVLLERGNKLRDQMIISSIDDDKRKGPDVANGPDFSMNGVDLSGMSDRRGSAGSFLKEILKADNENDVDLSALDSRAVDLMFGGTGAFDYNMMMNGGPGSSISDDMDVMSDPGDPIHSESILQELFYKNPESEVSDLSELSGDESDLKKTKSVKRRASTASVEDPSNQRPPSRRSSISSLTFPEPQETEDKPKKKIKTPKRKARLKTKRTGSKKRRRSRSSARSTASEYSDSDRACTPRSELSQVSFDLPASDLDEPEHDEPSRSKKVDGLSVERLTLLGRVHVARVVIDALHLTGQELNTSSSSKKSFKFKTVGRPPKPSPKAKKSMTYFIEYQFPVVATSRDKYSPNALATEVMRVASKKVSNGLVQFNHRSVFPIMFDGNAVDNWWKSALVFKVYGRSAGQKVPSLIGSCGIPMKSVLKSESLFVDRELEIRESINKNSSINSSIHKSDLDGLYGNLKVSIELASDSKDFSTHLARTKLAEMSGKSKLVPIPAPVPHKPRPPPAPSQNVVHTQPEPQHLTTQPQFNKGSSRTSSAAQIQPIPKQISHQSQYTDYSPEHVTLHTLLLVPEGRGISTQGIPSLVSMKRHPVFPVQPHALSPPGVKGRDMNVRNTYLVCRMFWCDDAVHSNVCWGTADPAFHFSQVAPMLMSTALLERMRNNFMVIEVWDKKTSAESDQLIGIVKISLHQFYMSFRDKKIANTLLKSQFPVIALDNYLPIVNPLNGSQFGQLQVCLAIGSAEQVAALQRIKLDGVAPNHLPERPQHYLERNDLQQSDDISPPHIGTESIVEHIFEVVIEGLRGLTAFENMMWGEADCFVQYHFPAQSNNQVKGAPVIKHAVPSMKSFRSATTLCIPDPTFNDVTRHRIVLSMGTPVQRELLTACARTGGGGLPFEVWCRYYHPNVRDQCIAKTNLPLAKLCAMVTMQKRGEPSVQTFALPLTQVGTDSEMKDPESKSKMKESGLMDVTIHYKTNTIQNELNAALQKNLSGSQVCISVSVIRATGLKAAAESIAHLDTGMQYPAEVGVNSYVKVRLSFLQKQDERLTRTIARTFCPEYSHHMDFPCPLLWTEPDSDAMTLAEILECGEITLEIWHQVPGMSSDFDRHLLQDMDSGIKGRQLLGKTGDVLLGTVTLSLASLLTHRTGITGWYAVNSPPSGWNEDTSYTEETNSGNRGLERVVGGLEMAVKFAHHNDRERVIHTARGVGWSPIELNVEEEDAWESDDEGSGRYQNVTVSVDQVSFPVQNALITGQNSLDKSARCYVRYKVYDKGAVVSKIMPMSVNSEGYIVSQLNHNHNFQISVTSPYKWYLREEKLEIQIWVTYASRKHHKNKPQHRDKLIGTAYIDMESLNDERRKQHRVSGMYPLFKPGSSSLGGAFARAHITSKPQFGPLHQDQSEDDLEDELSEKSVTEDPDYDPNDSFHQLSSLKKEKSKKSNLSVVEEKESSVFSVVISIDRAMHLPHIVDKSRSDESHPNAYVSYQTSESSTPSYTAVYHNSDSPIWDHQHETKLSTELLYQENKNLVLKVWHKPHGASKEPDKSADRVLGFVSVDLTPLLSGLQAICGWYNITDFNGQCKGQIMVNICPQDSVTQYNLSEHGVQPTSLPAGVSTSGIWFCDPPMSLPTTTAPFTSNLPHFNAHYDQVQNHHQQLQQQLSENIRTFLQRHEENQESPVSTLPSNVTLQTSLSSSVPSLSQVPSLSTAHYDGGASDSSRSYLFSSLRKQMQDLDEITYKLKQKLVTSPPTTGSSFYVQHPPQYVTSYDTPHLNQSGSSIPVTCQSQQLANSLTQSGVSTLSSLQFAQSRQDTVRQNEAELMLTGSQEAESSQTGADSGAFSATHSSEKYQDHDALDSHRSGSDKLDTFRFGTTPRDFVGLTETNSTLACDSTPRDQSNNSDTGINMKFTPRDDELLSTSNTFTSNATPRDPTVLGVTPRDNYSPREITENSDPSSLGFLYHGENSQRSTGSFKLDSARSSNGNGNGHNHVDPKEMSIIQEKTEYEGSDGEGDPNYYHRYRDILDEEEKEDDSDAERSDEDVIMPRTLNDVSGKFGGIPSSDHSFHRTLKPRDKMVSNDINSSATNVRDKMNGDSFFDIESVPNSRTPQRTQVLREQFVEKDSWFSDNEDDEENERSRYKPSWSPKSNKHEEFNLNLHENIDDLNRSGDADTDRLLENVDLESENSGSVTQRERMSRVSSAGSQRSLPSRSEYSAESDHVPKSPRALYNKVVDELDDYFYPNETTPKTRDHTEAKLSVESANSSRSATPVPTIRESEIDTNLRNSDANQYSDYEEDDFESRKTKKSSFKSESRTSAMPNFFLPAQHLEASMKALDIATSGPSHPNSEKDSDVSDDPERQQGKTKEAFHMKQKLSVDKKKFNGQTKGRQLPTAEEAKRIAKIFSSKLS